MLIHRELGPGFLEATYQDAMELELAHRRIPFQSQIPIEVWFRGRRLGGIYRADLRCYREVLVELKAIPTVGQAEVSQLAHYLAAAGAPLGLLLNFGAQSLQFQRVLPRRSTLVGPLRSESVELRATIEAAERGPKTALR